MPTLGVIVAAYLLGSVSFAVVVSKIFGLPDPHTYGSGNPGATNVLRTGHKAAAALTLLGDGIKGFVAVWAANRLGASWGCISVTCIRCSIISPAARACRRRRASRSQCLGSWVSRWRSSG
jgi:acyl-phosphate glycerol 3-phosphate acyltransferase